MTATQSTHTTTAASPLRVQSFVADPRPPSAGTSQDALMTIREVAAACRLSESAVRRAIADGELPAVKLRSRLRIIRSDFDAWVDSQRRQVPVRPNLAVNPSAGRQRRAATAGSFRALVQADAERSHAR